MVEIKAVHQCLFCPQTFNSAGEKDDHIVEHFAQEICTDCDQKLLRIGNTLYTPHNALTCIKQNFKLEEAICRDPEQQENSQCNESVFAAIIRPSAILEQADIANDGKVEFMPELTVLNNELTHINDENKSIESVDFKYEPSINIEFQSSSNESNGESKSLSNTDTELIDRKCDICGGIFASKKSLKVHRNITHGAPGHFPCTMCNLVFTRKDSRRKHIKNKHNPFNDNNRKVENDQIESFENNESQSILDKLDESFRACENNKDTKCNICGKIMSSKSSLKVHKNITHSAPGHFPCTMCNLVFTRKDSRRKHMKMRHDPSCIQYKCIHCNRVFLKETSMVNHLNHCNKRMEKMKSKTDAAEIIDNYIKIETAMPENQTFAIENDGSHSIEYGKTTESKKSQSLEICDMCGKTFINIGNIRRHQAVVHKVSGAYPCGKCRFVFFTADGLDKHQSKCKPTRIGKNFQCPIDGCNRLYFKRKSLLYHKRKEHGLKS